MIFDHLLFYSLNKITNCMTNEQKLEYHNILKQFIKKDDNTKG